MNDISRGTIEIKPIADKEIEFQFIRQLGSTSYGGASIGECFAVANQMNPPSPDAWVREFEQMAQWQKRDGLERMVKGHVVSGRQQLLKASNSFRAAEYYAPCSNPLHREYGMQSADCFSIALSGMDVHFESHAIPYKNINIPVYFISPANDGEKRHTVIIVSGFDGTMEEEFMMRGYAAIERNMNVIHVAGPGQMDVFRRYPQTHFEPDYENVIKKVINHFEQRQEIEMRDLALMGISLGGYFATRAACYEPRIKLLIANSPILNLFDYLSSFLSFDPMTMPDSEDFGVTDLASIPDEAMSQQLKVQTEQLITRFGQGSFKNTFKYLKEFNITNVIPELPIPCLALIGKDEGREPHKQFQTFTEITGATAYEFSQKEGASSHCQVGNVPFANAIVYDWLQERHSLK